MYPVAVSLDSLARSLKPGAFYGLSCRSPGNCVAGGWYLRRTGLLPGWAATGPG